MKFGKGFVNTAEQAKGQEGGCKQDQGERNKSLKLAKRAGKTLCIMVQGGWWQAVKEGINGLV